MYCYQGGFPKIFTYSEISNKFGNSIEVYDYKINESKLFGHNYNSLLDKDYLYFPTKINLLKEKDDLRLLIVLFNFIYDQSNKKFFMNGNEFEPPEFTIEKSIFEKIFTDKPQIERVVIMKYKEYGHFWTRDYCYHPNDDNLFIKEKKINEINSIEFEYKFGSADKYHKIFEFENIFLQKKLRIIKHLISE